MIESSPLDYKTTGSKLFTTTELNLETFFSRANKFRENDIYSKNMDAANSILDDVEQKMLILDEDSNETNIENDVFNIKSNSNFENENQTSSLEEEQTKEEFLLHYFNSSKDNNSDEICCDKKSNIFNINYKIRFDVNEAENSSLSQIGNEKKFLTNKTLPKIKRRRENLDNLRKKIKTSFFNNFLYKLINSKLKGKQSKLYLVKFPISFVNDIRKGSNKNIINMTLLEIMLKKELYNEKDLANYYHNLKVVENKEALENVELKKILNKKYCDLFEEYINSKEFNIDEINRLKKNNMDNIYLERYIYQSKHFIEYFGE